jgi:hypothetical protein
MNKPDIKWYSQIYRRRSRRQFEDKLLEIKDMDKLTHFAFELNSSFDDVRLMLVENSYNEIREVIGLFMSISNTPLYAVIIGKKESDLLDINTGFIGESFILEASSVGVDSTWIINSKQEYTCFGDLDMEDDERICAVIALGYALEDYSDDEKLLRKMYNAFHKKSLKDVCEFEKPSDLPRWSKVAIDAARLAPSAINRQSWKFDVGDDYIKIMVDSEEEILENVPKVLDCSIAMVHLETALNYQGKFGEWEILEYPDVAIYKLNKE